MKKYIIGYISSIVLTVVAYAVVQIHVSSEHSVISHEVLLPVILGLAVLQLIIQLIFFLHLNAQPGREWKFLVFLSTLSLVLIVIVGSIWIMGHLNYNMMASPTLMQQYINNQQGGF